MSEKTISDYMDEISDIIEKIRDEQGITVESLEFEWLRTKTAYGNIECEIGSVNMESTRVAL